MKCAKLLLAIVLVVGWTSAAAAESAWVLWIHTNRGGFGKSPFTTEPVPWQVWQGFNTLEDSEHVKEKVWEEWAKKFRPQEFLIKWPLVKKVEERPFERITIMQQGFEASELWTTVYRFVCLPGTIDPREKKQ